MTIMDLIPDKNFSLSPSDAPLDFSSLRLIPVGDEYLLFNPAGARWTVVNNVAAFIIELCDGYKSLDDIRRILLNHTNLDLNDHLSSIAYVRDSILNYKPPPETFKPLERVFLNITNDCNLRCEYCYFGSYRLSHDVLSPGDYARIVDEIIDINVDSNFIITGGEPLTHGHLFDILDALDRRVHHFSIITNGILMNDDFIDQMKKYENASLQISIDSYDDEGIPKILNDRMKRVLNRLKNNKIDFVVSSTVSRASSGEIEKLIRYCKSMEYKYRTSLLFPTKSSIEYFKENRLDDDSIIKLMDLNIDNVVRENARLIANGEKRTTCCMGYSIFSILPDGLVYPCNHLIGKDMVLGGIRTDKIKNIINHAFDKFRDINVDDNNFEDCFSCDYKYICTSGCPADSFNLFGRFKKPYSYCGTAKNILPRMMYNSVKENRA